MTGRPDTAAVPRVALTLDEAAASLGLSRDSLERHVLADLHVIRRGKIRLVPVAELERWATSSAEQPLARALRAA